MYPFMSKVNFELYVFGSEQRGRFKVQSIYQAESKQWTIDHIILYTGKDASRIL